MAIQFMMWCVTGEDECSSTTPSVSKPGVRTLVLRTVDLLCLPGAFTTERRTIKHTSVRRCLSLDRCIIQPAQRFPAGRAALFGLAPAFFASTGAFAELLDSFAFFIRSLTSLRTSDNRQWPGDVILSMALQLRRSHRQWYSMCDHNSGAHRRAASRDAFLTSGFSARFFWMTCQQHDHQVSTSQPDA